MANLLLVTPVVYSCRYQLGNLVNLRSLEKLERS